MAATRESDHRFEKGDWVVHRIHGVGQVKGIVKKRIGGHQAPYYRVQTDNSILFIPVDARRDDRLRRAATRRQLAAALRALEKPAREMAEDHSERRQRIRNVKTDGSLASMVRLVRDLTWRRDHQRLNNTEERALRRFRDLVVEEWSVARGITPEEAAQELGERLRTLEGSSAPA
jgi:RNA polymerase-interacting CarD/CdnL/TRCF family regulator